MRIFYRVSATESTYKYLIKNNKVNNSTNSTPLKIGFLIFWKNKRSAPKIRGGHGKNKRPRKRHDSPHNEGREPGFLGLVLQIERLSVLFQICDQRQLDGSHNRLLFVLSDCVPSSIEIWIYTYGKLLRTRGRPAL